MNTIKNDLKYAFRQLRKKPGFTVTAVLTLALCLGANLTIFAVVDAILLRSLPFPQPDRLVTLYYTYPKLPSAGTGASLTSYYERRGQIPAFSSLSAIGLATAVVGDSGETSIENLGRVTPEFFATLGVKPFLGRTFVEEEMTYQTDQVAMLSYEYWQSHFNGDAKVLGRSIRMDGIPRVIVGVLPPEFRFLSFSAPVYMPLSSEESERDIGARHSLGTVQIARLAPGATLAQARTQIAVHDEAHAAEFPQAQIVADAGCRTVVAPLHADHVAMIRPTLMLLQAGALCLLLIGCVNLANLLLIRASHHGRESAIRRALGAGHYQVIRTVLTETLLLTTLGTLCGVWVGALGVRLFEVFGAESLPLGTRIALNGRLVVTAAVGALVTGGLLAVPVIWFHLRGRLAAMLKSETRSNTTDRSTQRLHFGFIVAQISMAFVLVAGASLLGLSLKRAMGVAPGFRADHVLTGQFNLTWQGYHDLDSFHGFFDRLRGKTNALPGVSAVGTVSNVPLNGERDKDAITVLGYTPRPGESVALHHLYGVAGDYFAAMGIPLQAGRYLAAPDARGEQRVCVVDEYFARHYWPDGDAVGRQIYRGADLNDGDAPYTIVGVIGAVKQTELTETQVAGAIYFPFSRVFMRNYFLVARTSQPPDLLAPTLSQALRETDPEIPLTDIRSMDARIADSLVTRRSPALMAGLFSMTALLLAAIGLYGVMAYGVAQRTSEFGIRMMLGAGRRDILHLVLLQGACLIGVGLVVGLAVSLMLGDTLAAFLFNVSPSDPLTLISVAAVLGLIAAVACVTPAWRAAKVDPMEALRYE